MAELCFLVTELEGMAWSCVKGGLGMDSVLGGGGDGMVASE